MKFTDEQGKQWEFKGEYHPVLGDYFLTGYGEIKVATNTLGRDRAIVHPVPIIHEFGGIKFEETGEHRRAEAGEWHLFGNVISCSNSESGYQYDILRLQGG